MKNIANADGNCLRKSAG